MKEIKVLDYGYVKLIESYGNGEARENEAGIIEAARQSTQGNFRGWDVWHCSSCGHSFESKYVQHNVSGLTVHDKYLATISGKICENPQWSNDEKLLNFLYKMQHTTPFEFCGMVIEVKAPIAVFREWHRHRTQSYNEMSARYAPLPNENYLPTKERLFLTQKKNRQAQAAEGAKELTYNEAECWLAWLNDLYEHAEKTYQHGLDNGVPKEIARMCLPVGRYSQMRASANLLNWLRFLTLRMNPNAQWEIRQFANAVGKFIEQEFPKTWNIFSEINKFEE